MNSILFTIVYDNYADDDSLRTGHGFACHIQGLQKTVLFDTGWSGQTLHENMRRLGLAFVDVDVVVLSHMHWDHIGGLDAVLHHNPQLAVRVPRSFSERLKEEIRRSGATVVGKDHQHAVCPGAWTTELLTDTIEEQALCIQTTDGTMVVTGCAHLGIVNLARAAGETCGFPLHAALGGFHMSGASAGEIKAVIAQLRKLGVRSVAPCHCSGDLARELFKEAYGENYYTAGVGWKLRLEKAQMKDCEAE